MSYFLRPHLISLLTAAKTVYQQKKGQNLTSLISKFTHRLSQKAVKSCPHIEKCSGCEDQLGPDAIPIVGSSALSVLIHCVDPPRNQCRSALKDVPPKNYPSYIK
jgi:hypothetical protein